MDNAVVKMASTSIGAESITNVRKYSQKLKKYINVTRPKLIAKYNQYMGGTDQMDQNNAVYRIGIRVKNGGGHFLHWFWTLQCITAGNYIIMPVLKRFPS